MQRLVAKIATSSAVYSIDKEYSYQLPMAFEKDAVRGARVVVPFGIGNKAAFGFILEVYRDDGKARLKEVISVYPDFCLSEQDISLAQWMCARYFCTFFEAAACLVPPGIWGKEQDGQIKGVVKDKMISNISLKTSYEGGCAMVGKGKSAQKRQAVLDCFLDYEELPEKELSYLTGASKSVIDTMCKNGILNKSFVQIYRRPTFSKGAPAYEIELSSEQQKAYEEISKGCEAGSGVGLLHGVTGSGKTEIYIKLIMDALKQGKTAIMLVPEIALTPQTVKRLCRFFKDDLAIMHSSLTTTQRYDEYKRVAEGKARVVVGTRSGIFAPLKNIGIIIIDEEHEYSYKSESTPRYSAIDIAKVRAVSNNAFLLLGSATPSVESYYYGKTGRYSLHKVNSRFGDTPLPKVVIADMRKKNCDDKNGLMSYELEKALKETIEADEQAILFVNRRGNSRITCVDCGDVPGCPHCSVALTYHLKNGRLMCHYCGFSKARPRACEKCGSHNIFDMGMGTQKGEELVREILPEVKIIRMDADTTVERVSHEKILEEFGKNGQILIGTQMVTKGLDFDNVTLVGVLDCDVSLYSSDFRGASRTFSLLSQVVGRAGRRRKQGRAVLQTYSPNSFVIQNAAAQDYEAFYQDEIKSRELLGLPPFNDIFVFSIYGKDEAKTLKAALGLSGAMFKAMREGFSDVKAEILGPVAPNIYKINDKYRYNISFKGKDNKRTREFIRGALMAFAKGNKDKSIALTAEINPIV